MHGLAFDIAHLLAGGMVVVSFLLLYQDRVYALLNVFALHSLVLALAVGWQAYIQEARHLYVTAGIALIFKAVVIPTALHRIVQRLGIHRTLEVVGGVGRDMLAGTALVALAILVMLPVTAGADALAREDLAFALAVLLLGLLLFLLLLAILYVWNRRRALLEGEGTGATTYSEPAPVTKSAARPSLGATAATAAAARPAAPAAEPVAVPIARFRTSYTRGHDTYDDAFSIENANGDFLGECGVGISETIGATAPKNVTAFEVWLFDKNDIRTITKVIMSDHAFFDDALKAKLAPKGEPVLAREGETIVLETATLIINAEITEMDYGEASELPDTSYFERFTIELSAWAKEGETALPGPGEGEDLLRY